MPEGETKKAMFRHGVEPFEVGRDSISPVNALYKAKMPFEFTGKIDKITFESTDQQPLVADSRQQFGIGDADLFRRGVGVNQLLNELPDERVRGISIGGGAWKG